MLVKSKIYKITWFLVISRAVNEKELTVKIEVDENYILENIKKNIKSHQVLKAQKS